MIVKRGEIWTADLGTPDGHEQRGFRPVLIIQNDVGNEYSPTVIVAAITDMEKRYMHTHQTISKHVSGLKKDSVVLLEQIRTIDKRKLQKQVGKLPDHVMGWVNKKISISVGLAPVVIKEKTEGSYLNGR